MRSFLVHSLLFLLLASAMVAGYVWLYKDFFPAPRLTRNISLNEQLSRIKDIHDGRIDHSPHGKVNILAVGSSMSLNNLNSRAVVEHFGDSSFVNVGAWSTRMHQTATLTSMLQDKLQPHTVILTSNMEDWMKGKDLYVMDSLQIADYISKWGRVESYLRTLRPSYYLREMERNKIRMTDPTYYDFLGFDNWGGATINVPPERVEPERNVYTIPRPDQVDHDLYPYLEWLAAHLAGKNVRLIFIQSPYREGDQTEELSGILAAHAERVQRIMQQHGHTYVTTTDRIWPNHLYIDPSHFRAEGSYMFTQYALEKLSGEHSPRVQDADEPVVLGHAR